MLSIVSDIVVLAVAALLLWIAYVDFQKLRITNQSVLILLAAYLFWAAMNAFQGVVMDVVAGLILFLIGLVMWLMRAMGAGDVKLYFAVGLFVGFHYLLVYASFLIVVSFCFFALLMLARRFQWQGNTGTRLTEIAVSGRAPYAIPIVSAAIPTILMRAFSGY